MPENQKKDQPPADEEKNLSGRDLKKAIAAQQSKVRDKREKTTFFGQTVWVGLLSAADLDHWRMHTQSKDPEVKCLSLAKLVQLSLHDKKGDRIYEHLEITQLAGFKPAKELENISDIAMRINGYSAEGVEEILKNLLRIFGDDGLLELREIIDAQLQSSSKSTPPTS